MAEINTMPTKTEKDHCWCKRDWHQPIEYDWKVGSGYDCPLCLAIGQIDDLNKEIDSLEKSGYVK